MSTRALGRIRLSIPEETKGKLDIALRWGLIALALSVLIYRSLRQSGYFVDDAYITFRYAANLARGYGLVWNIGGEPVEGYTSLLHLVFLAVGIWAGLPLPYTAILVSSLSVVGLIYIFLSFIRKESGAYTLIGALLLAVFLFDTRLAIHVTAGLDTVLFAFLLAACFVVSVRFVETPGILSAGALAIIDFLCLLGRPDAAAYIAGQVLVIGGFSIYLFIIQRNDTRLLRYAALSYGALFVIGSMYLIWKQYYFGYLLPNPFYIKSNQIGIYGLPYVVTFAQIALTQYGLLVIAALFFLDLSRFVSWLKSRMARLKLALLLVPPALFLLYYTTVIHEVPYANRFEYPVYFLLTIALALPFSMGTSRFRLPNTIAARVGLALGLVLFSILTYKITSTYFPWPQIMEENFYRPIGYALQRTHLGRQATIVCQAAGTIPYLSEFSHIDPVGLTDNFLSGRIPVNAWERERYIWGRDPDVYIGPEPPASIGAADWSGDPLSQTKYLQEIVYVYQNDLGLKNSLGRLSVQEMREVIHLRMTELRDRWTFLGEIPYPLPITSRYTSFGYVRTDSPYFQVLVNALEPLVAYQPKDIVLDRIRVSAPSE